MVAAFLMGSVCGSLAGKAGAGPESPRESGAEVYVVRQGDTVWGVASVLAGPEGDPRPIVDRLLEANHIQHGLVHPGDRLILPDA